MKYGTDSVHVRKAPGIRRRYRIQDPYYYEPLEGLSPEDDYRHSTISPRRCVWDGSCETCPSTFRCNFH